MTAPLLALLPGLLTQLKCASVFILLLSPFVAFSSEHPPFGACLLPGHRGRCINLSLGGQFLGFDTLPRRGSSVLRCRNYAWRVTCPLLELENEHPATWKLYKDTYPCEILPSAFCTPCSWCETLPHTSQLHKPFLTPIKWVDYQGPIQ